ncbi:MAG: Stealth CR1 domain-containing protein [Bacteroidales bacterium]|nr:Stealth CR1 domain-containing protein [Bacteroidales bacterium]
MYSKNPIDVVIPWVDGSDSEWLMSYSNHANEAGRDSNSAVRYRDWDNLQYLFRGIEKFMPWVRTVHLVTNGQRPAWLNMEAEKLHFVCHEEFIPSDCLPTFSVRPIELNIHRIPGLADRFIYFNDDFFVTAPVSEDRFFHDGLPCDMLALDAIQPVTPREHVLQNNVAIINKHFSKWEQMRTHKRDYFCLRYGRFLYRTLALIPWHYYTYFFSTHLPQAYLKSVFEDLWSVEYDVLMETTRHRFRDITDVNQSLFRYWQMVTGRFYPRNMVTGTSRGSVTQVTDENANTISKMIRQQKYNIFVLNDCEDIRDFERCKTLINDALQSVLPEKSRFEKIYKSED